MSTSRKKLRAEIDQVRAELEELAQLRAQAQQRLRGEAEERVAEVERDLATEQTQLEQTKGELTQRQERLASLVLRLARADARADAAETAYAEARERVQELERLLGDLQHRDAERLLKEARSGAGSDGPSSG